MHQKHRPSLPLSTAVILILTVGWSVLRLVLFRESVLPLTFVLPMLVCIWTQRRWQLVAMATAFFIMAVVKFTWIMPAERGAEWEHVSAFSATLFNIAVGGFVVHLVMRLREHLETSYERVSEQNTELEAQTEELSQQNEEIKAQTEELAQQNEEIESQAEELERQNEELQESNGRLSSREEMLQAVLQSSRTAGGGQQVLDDVCRRALEIIGEPAEALAVLELDGEGDLRLRANARVETQPPLRERWPLEHSLARIVLKEDRTAYVDDLHERKDLAAPFAHTDTVRSLLVTPLRAGGVQAGVLAVCGRGVSHWTKDQFRVVEWIAGQCGMILEGLRWQDALKNRANEIEAANKAKDHFLATLSHELRTPLTPVLAAAGSLESDPRLPADMKEDLGVIRRNVAVQSRLIDDLLDLTRIGRGKIELHCQVLSVATLLRDAAAIVAGDLDAKEQTLTLQLQDLPADAAVNGDGARLQQVFWNLLKNAVKFSPAKGRIAVAARVIHSPRRVIVDVSDGGIGIDPADVDRIFLPFEQATAGKHTDNGHGLGLGLCIAKAVVELHGGTARVASAGIGKGATFTIELPLVDASLLISPATPAASSDGEMQTTAGSPSNASLRILLVEDHGDTGRLLARLLKNQGHAVVHALDVASALQNFHENEFDLLVSDLGLPDGSGLDLMREIHALRPGLAGICLSGYGMEADIQASRDAGFLEHLTKPIEVQQLQAALSRVAHNHSHRPMQVGSV